MADIIRLLPDSVANQIAAGEVVQRPASAIKEMLENAIDSGATEIKLIIKDAGKTLIQLIDNGCGMSDTDARMSFERHATSKIRNADDLFAIRTLGFRGEALASIAAIAQVELKTKRHGEEVGTQIIIEGSEVKSQTACQCSEGTSISVKNLFYNVPARRNFLKSDKVEMGHILNEFYHVSLPNPDIAFSLYSNNSEVFHLTKSSLKQRLINLFGNSYNQKLIPVELNTDLITISGFIGKPEAAKKTRGDQYFFVNNRYIKHAYLYHAVSSAFTELIPGDHFPSYFLFLDVDPHSIDINIHPTKTEIKFVDEHYIYNVLRAAVKQSLGKFNITPSIDFDIEASFNNTPPISSSTIIRAPQIKLNPNYNPFEDSSLSQKLTKKNLSNNENWEKLYSRHADNQIEIPLTQQNNENEKTSKESNDTQFSENEVSNKNIFQFQDKYILSNVKSGLLIIDQQAASERILFEKLLLKQQNNSSSQHQLFPVSIECPLKDAELLEEMRDDLKDTGIEIDRISKTTFIVNAVPIELADEDMNSIIENMLENFKNNPTEIKSDKQNQIALLIAKNSTSRSKKTLQPEEMYHLIDELFACSVPYTSPSGRPTLTIISSDEIEKRFK